MATRCPTSFVADNSKSPHSSASSTGSTSPASSRASNKIFPNTRRSLALPLLDASRLDANGLDTNLLDTRPCPSPQFRSSPGRSRSRSHSRSPPACGSPPRSPPPPDQTETSESICSDLCKSNLSSPRPSGTPHASQPTTFSPPSLSCPASPSKSHHRSPAALLMSLQFARYILAHHASCST